ncbi:HNH endonuclease [Posidoniimonas polymericola]|uniref:HNH endonuclease n=1 Tax=Posidoniimonas polymericola TaxID=2528002 RepID=UPI0018D4951C|nr:HNH endonuclease [Posidoniimonas polymericola]
MHTVKVFRHPKYGRLIQFGDAAIKRKVKIKPTGNPRADYAAANRELGKPAGYDWTKEPGINEPMTWHHDNKKGWMHLVPFSVHDKIGHSGGAKIWGGGYR